MNKTRSISHNLSPISLKKIGLQQAIEGLAERYREKDNLEIEIKLGDIDSFFAEGWNTNFYRIIQEALVNVVKHSKASRVEISSRMYDGMLRFSIKDNGIGLGEGPEADKKGLGMTLMSKRTAMLKGLIAFSTSAEGFEVLIDIPHN